MDILSVVMLSVAGTLRKCTSEEKEEVKRGVPHCSSPCLPAVRCGRHLSQPIITPDVISHRIYLFFSEKGARGGLPIFVQFFSGPYYIPTFLKHGFNILMGIDEYNYIRIYVC